MWMEETHSHDWTHWSLPSSVSSVWEVEGGGGLLQMVVESAWEIEKMTCWSEDYFPYVQKKVGMGLGGVKWAVICHRRCGCVRWVHSGHGGGECFQFSHTLDLHMFRHY